jgi:OFA family oxalate/formate antiporter-like MFS transporter
MNRSGNSFAGLKLPFFYGWVIVAVVFVSEFLAAGVGTVTVPLFFKPISEEMGWSLTQLTGSITAQAIAGIVFVPVAGILLDRIGARPVMIFGSVTAGIGLLLLTQVQEPWHFWVLYGIVGALGLHSMGQFTGPVVVAKWFIRRRGRAVAIITSGTTIGGLLIAPIIGFMMTTHGWRQVWGIMGIIILVIMVPILAMFIRRQPESIGLRPDGESVEMDYVREKNSSDPQERIWTLRQALHTRAIWILILSMELVSLSATVVVVHTVPFLSFEQGMSTQAVSIVLTLRLFSATLSRFFWGFLMERFPVHLCLSVGFFFRAVGPISLVLLPYPVNVLVLLISNIPGGAMAVLQPMAFANYYGRTFFGTIQGIIRPILSIPQLVGPLLIAMIFDTTGTFYAGFLLASFLGFIASGVALLARPPVHSSSPE